MLFRIFDESLLLSKVIDIFQAEIFIYPKNVTNMLNICDNNPDVDWVGIDLP